MDMEQALAHTSALVRSRLPSWLEGNPELDDQLAEQANALILRFRPAPAAESLSARLAATKLILDVTAVAMAEGGPSSAEPWRAAAFAISVGTKLHVVVDAIAGFPPWFVDAQRIHWFDMLRSPENVVVPVEQAFMDKYTDPVALRYALG